MPLYAAGFAVSVDVGAELSSLIAGAEIPWGKVVKSTAVRSSTANAFVKVTCKVVVVVEAAHLPMSSTIVTNDDELVMLCCAPIAGGDGTETDAFPIAMEGSLMSRPHHSLIHDAFKNVHAVLRGAMISFYQSSDCKTLLNGYLVTGVEEWDGKVSALLALFWVVVAVVVVCCCCCHQV
jgi:hypothetical protein